MNFKTSVSIQDNKFVSKIKAWFWAIRPFSISAAVVPVFVGSAFAFSGGKLSLFRFLLVLIAGILVQMATNLIDEYSDHARPEGEQKIIAPYKVIALGKLTAKEVKLGAFVCFCIATAIGLYLIYLCGPPILFMCLGAAAAAYFYSAGPLPLGKIGLGQPLVFVFMGLVMVSGSYYVQTGSFTPDIFWLALPVGCTVTAILASNNIRDMEEDRAVQKRTIVTVFGRRVAWWEYLLLVAAAFLTMIVLVIAKQISPVALISMLAVPQSVLALRILRKGRNRPELARGVPATANLHWYFGALLAVGVALGRFIK
jgi:1,4-dihydroxy-2-naphthoate octaprenyltransferase